MEECFISGDNEQFIKATRKVLEGINARNFRRREQRRLSGLYLSRAIADSSRWTPSLGNSRPLSEWIPCLSGREESCEGQKDWSQYSFHAVKGQVACQSLRSGHRSVPSKKGGAQNQFNQQGLPLVLSLQGAIHLQTTCMVIGDCDDHALGARHTCPCFAVGQK